MQNMSLDSPETPAGLELGYARGHAAAAGLESQIDALLSTGLDANRIYTDDHSTGPPARSRPGFDALLDYARAGDTVVVPSIDSLGQTRTEILSTTRLLTERGIALRALRERVDSGDETGSMIIGVLASLGAVDDSSTRQPPVRRPAGSATLGRPRVLNDEQIELAERMRANGDRVPTIAGALGVSRATLYRTLAERRSNS